MKKSPNGMSSVLASMRKAGMGQVKASSILKNSGLFKGFVKTNASATKGLAKKAGTSQAKKVAATAKGAKGAKGQAPKVMKLAVKHNVSTKNQSIPSGKKPRVVKSFKVPVGKSQQKGQPKFKKLK